jgi:hypothetical protein
MNWRELPDIFLTRQLPEFPTESAFNCAQALWDMLDDVDTALDMYHPEPSAFVDVVSAIIARRFEHAKPEMFGDTEALIWRHQ